MPVEFHGSENDPGETDPIAKLLTEFVFEPVTEALLRAVREKLEEHGYKVECIEANGAGFAVVIAGLGSYELIAGDPPHRLN
jgi:hypothetical protein